MNGDGTEVNEVGTGMNGPGNEMHGVTLTMSGYRRCAWIPRWE